MPSAGGVPGQAFGKGRRLGGCGCDPRDSSPMGAREAAGCVHGSEELAEQKSRSVATSANPRPAQEIPAESPWRLGEFPALYRPAQPRLLPRHWWRLRGGQESCTPHGSPGVPGAVTLRGGLLPGVAVWCPHRVAGVLGCRGWGQRAVPCVLPVPVAVCNGSTGFVPILQCSAGSVPSPGLSRLAVHWGSSWGPG